MTDRRLVTALYGRTSKDDPRRVTIEIQQAKLRGWAVSDPLVSRVEGEFWDDGVTGKLPLWERPAGRELLAAVAAGRVEAVAVAYADRFGRTLLDGLQAVKRLEDARVKLVAIEDGWDARRADSPLYFQFRMMMAEEEHRRIAERMRNGKLRAMDRDNAPPGGPLTFGYRLGPRGQFEADPVEAPLVIRAFEMILEGCNQVEVLAMLAGSAARPGLKFQRRAAGALPAACARHEAARWHSSRVCRLLRNPTYLGERKWAGRVFPCPALIDRETWDRVQAILDGPARPYVRGDLSRGLLSGLLTCAGCGAKFYAGSIPHRGGKRWYYVCQSVRLSRGCRAKLLRTDETDLDVWAEVLSLLRDPAGFAQRLIAADCRASGDVGDLRAEEIRLTLQLEGLEQDARAVWVEQEANGWPLAWVTPRLNDLAGRREKVASALADTRRQIALRSLDREESAAVLAALARMRSRLRAGPSLEDKRDILRSLIAAATVRTTGEGKRKRAELHLEFRWGDVISSPRLPEHWSKGTLGDVTLTAVLNYGRAEG